MALNYAQLVAYIDGLYADGSLSEQDYADIVNYIVSNGNPLIDPRDLIQVRRGNVADLPNFAQAEPGMTLDTENFYLGGLTGNVKFYNSDVVDSIAGISIENYAHLAVDIGGASEDWYPAIVQALADLGTDGGEIVFTRTSYKYSTPIVIPNITTSSFVRLRGRHSWGSILYYTGTANPAIDAKGGVASGDRIYLEMKDIGVHYIGSTPSINGIELKYNTPSSNFFNVFVNGFTGSGVTSEDNWNLTFINLRSTNNTLDGFRREAGALNSIRFIGGEFNGNGRFGMYLRGRNHVLDGLSFESNGESGLFLSAVLGCTVNSPYLEDEGTAALLRMFGSSGVVINGVDISVFSTDVEMFYAEASNFTLNGFICEISGSVTAVTGKAIEIKDCRSFTLNNVDLRNISQGITLTNSYGSINQPEFAYVTTPVTATDHAFIWVNIDMISDYFATSNIPATATKYIKKNYINKPVIGATADRPSGVFNGYQFYDTTIDKVLYWNGTAWTDAQGVPV